MRKLLAYFVFISITYVLYGQSAPSDIEYPELGLKGAVTWIDSTHIIVEYDWSDDSQLLDWEITQGSALVRESGSVTISGGDAVVRAMIWKQGIKCKRISVKDAAPLSTAGHLNFYCNLTAFTGAVYRPNPGLGAILATDKNSWSRDGVKAGDIGAPFLEVGVTRDFEFNVSTSGMTIRSSIDDEVYSYVNPSDPALERLIALGGWEGDTKWGKIIIEGEIPLPWQDEPIPPDFINIESNGSVFAPIIEVTGTPVIEWIFDDATTSASVTPTKDYSSPGARHNYLKVTPWSALIGINVGYDAIDGGYGAFDLLPNQNVLGIQNIQLASSLEYLCASYNLMTELDLRGLQALKFIELPVSRNLSTLHLGTHPVLERISLEECSLDSIDLSGCPALGDLRGAANKFTKINWGTIGNSLWHICIRDNPLLIDKIPDVPQFPILRELLIWNSNQSGPFVCDNDSVRMIDLRNNYYTSADITGSWRVYHLALSGNQLSSINLGNPINLFEVHLNDCGLTEQQVDYILLTLYNFNRTDGILELNGNAAPSEEGLVYVESLKTRGWEVAVTLVPVANITITGEEGETTITTNNGTLQLNAEVTPANSSDKSVIWSIVDNTGAATISADGLVTALLNGTVTAMATANDGSDIYGSLNISISNQITSDLIPVIVEQTEPFKIVVNQNEIITFLDNSYISWKASLYNSNGVLVMSKFVESEILTFHVSSLPPGIYFEVLSKGKNSKTIKVAKP